MRDIKLTFRCEGCEATITFPATEAGMIRECPECGGWVDVPEATRRDPEEDRQTWGRFQEELNQRYFEENKRQQAENARQIKLADDQQTVKQRNLEREAAFIARREELFARELRLLERFELIARSLESVLAQRSQEAE